ncbi:MAG: hypothetical protein II079_01210, partial [Oscillospiraceae bacterium]|nr:hypothetical protein [Oscillospiraceae bacterium]
MIQDIGLNRLKNHYDPAVRPIADSRIACFRGRKLLCRLGEGDELTLPTCAQLGAAAEESIYIFSIDETTYFLCRAEAVPEPEGFTYEDIAVFRRAKPRETAFAAVT